MIWFWMAQQHKNQFFGWVYGQTVKHFCLRNISEFLYMIVCYMFCHLICYIFTIEPKMSIKRKHKFMSLIILLKPFHGSMSHKSGTLMTHDPDSSTFALEERLDFKKVMKHALETLRIACLFLPLDHLRDSKVVFFRKTNCKIKASKNFWLSC